MLTTYCKLPYIHVSTVHDFHNDNVNVTKCISCFRLNLKLKPCFGLHVPIAAKPNAFCTYIMGGLRDIVTFIRLIIYRCTNMGVQCMQCVPETTYKCLSSNGLVCNKSETCSILFCSGCSRGMESKL